MPAPRSLNRTGALAVVGGAAIALYNVVPTAGLQSIIYEGLGTLAVVSVALRARRCAGRARAGFAVLACGLGCWVEGDVLSDVLRFTSAGGSIPYPSVADGMYVAG